MNVDGLVAERISAARVRIQSAKRRRDELSAARRRGLAARHAAKLRNLATDRPSVADEPMRSCACGRTPDPGICPKDCPPLPAGGHCRCTHEPPKENL